MKETAHLEIVVYKFATILEFHIWRSQKSWKLDESKMIQEMIGCSSQNSSSEQKEATFNRHDGWLCPLFVAENHIESCQCSCNFEMENAKQTSVLLFRPAIPLCIGISKGNWLGCPEPLCSPQRVFRVSWCITPLPITWYGKITESKFLLVLHLKMPLHTKIWVPKAACPTLDINKQP